VLLGCRDQVERAGETVLCRSQVKSFGMVPRAGEKAGLSMRIGPNGLGSFPGGIDSVEGLRPQTGASRTDDERPRRSSAAVTGDPPRLHCFLKMR